MRPLTLAAALATALLAVFAPTASPATEQSTRGALIRELQAAYADELRAIGKLGEDPPQLRAAHRALRRSMRTLKGVMADSTLSIEGFQHAHRALTQDTSAANGISAWEFEARYVDEQEVRERIEEALLAKAQALGTFLPQASPRAPQCANGKDDDGDGTRDAQYDSGCSNRADATEGSALSCTLEYVPRGTLYSVDGTCSGPFFELEIVAPPGAVFDTERAPAVRHDRHCTYATARALDCLMSDGLANPNHVVDARWRERDGAAVARPLRVVITDYDGRQRILTLRPATTSPPAAPPFSLGPSPVTATGTFTNGRGGCPVATSFTDRFELLAPGDGTLTITQPATGDRVSGKIEPDGSFQLRSARESYDGKITGTAMTATYAYTTAGGCVETYDARFVLQR